MSNVNNTAEKVVDALNDHSIKQVNDRQIDSRKKAQTPKLSINGDPVDSEQWGRRLRIAYELADPHQLKEHLAKHVHASRVESHADANFDPDNPRHLRHALYTLSVKENSDVALSLIHI